MKWFKKRREPEYEIVSKDIPLTHLMRWFLYDTGLIDPNEIANRLNLTPVSDEGNVKEEEDSDYRMDAIADLIPFIEIMAEITADAITAIQVKDIEESLEDDVSQVTHEMTIMRQMYKVVALSSLISSFSAAVELGILSKDSVENMRLEDGNFNEQ
jgi:hypothetical protein